ncbi:MAG: hypothetical protein MdMp014T_2761 [Treponematales bacterium]
MLSRDDAVFTIGFDGPAAVVDGGAKRKFRGLSAQALAEKGLFRAAYAAALRDGRPGEAARVEEIYRAAVHPSARGGVPLDRLFGVFPAQATRAVEL